MGKKFNVHYVIYIIVLLIVFGSFAYSQVSHEQVVHNDSGISADGPLLLYTGSTTMSPRLDVIDWGDLYPDETKNYVISVYNDHPQNNLTLYLKTGNWTPEWAEPFFTLKWDLEETTLTTKTITKATLTLIVSEDIFGVKKFSFDIIVVGVEEEEVI